MNLAARLRRPGLVLLVVTLSVFAADTSFQLPPETARLKPGPGLELVNANCQLCHSVDYISTQPRLTQAQWQATVVKMQTRYGAPVTTNQIEAVVGYLVENYGTKASSKTPPPR